MKTALLSAIDRAIDEAIDDLLEQEAQKRVRGITTQRIQAQMLHGGNIVVEYNQHGKPSKFVVNSVKAGCNRHKVHVVVNGSTNWCYDRGALIDVVKESKP